MGLHKDICAWQLGGACDCREPLSVQEIERFRRLADQIKAGTYRLPVEGQLFEPAGKERHTSKKETGA